jgi:pimeloyl-ACP methyl ester carboxylesterase
LHDHVEVASPSAVAANRETRINTLKQPADSPSIFIAINHTFNTKAFIPETTLITMAGPGLVAVPTPHGTICVTDTCGFDLPTILFIHDNSFSIGIFQPFFTCPALLTTHRLIAFDLAGHGGSSDALIPSMSYTQPAYANAAMLVLRNLGVQTVTVVGWGLGGNVALELIHLLTSQLAANGMPPEVPPVRILGTMLIGTAPVGPENFAEGFRAGSQLVAAAGAEHLTANEMEAFAWAASEEPREEWMVAAVQRTDGRARRIMFDALRAGTGVDQREVVAREDVLVAVVNGKMDPFVNLEYVRSVQYGNLWGRHCFEMEGLQHAPFWGHPERFIPILMEFLVDAEAENTV